MDYNKIIYLMALISLICTFSFLLTRDNERVVKMAFVINILTSCPLMLVGEIYIFLSLAFLNFFIFFIAKIAALGASEKISSQEPYIDLPIIVIVLIIVGMAVISIFQNVDYLNIGRINASWDGPVKSIDFHNYTDIIVVIFVVSMSAILFFNMRVLRK